MHPDIITIGPITLHSYGLMIAIGVIAAYTLSERLSKANGLNPDEITNYLIYILVGAAIGTKLLYVITLIINGTFTWSSLWDFKNGFVVYGGIIGGVLAALIYSRVKKLDFWAYADSIIPTVAMAQGFGRIGCFLAGCCYGQETTSSLGVVFPANAIAPSGPRLFPIQLVFSVADFANFALLMFLMKRGNLKGRILCVYLITYAIGRFVLEFFRGDIERGQIGILSTSQLVSVIILIIGAALFIVRGKKNKTEA